jgi:signal transduction histidine kinase
VFTLNTLLNKTEGTVEPKVTACLKRITQNSAEMTEMIRRLQAVVRPAEARKLTHFANLVRQLDREIGENLRAKGIQFITTVESNVPEVPVLPESLLVALSNLVSNAETALQESSSERKLIKVIVRPHNLDAVILEVQDNGKGVSSDIVSNINSPGFALTTRPGRGLGLGLEIVRRIAYLHGGKFRIENGHESPGAKAIIVLPMRSTNGSDERDSLD